LEISHKTVENHRATVLYKMGADNPTQLAHMLLSVE
jgi:DNA-binding NarL/FixJ family response regulator